jgi:hypothetical protein
LSNVTGAGGQYHLRELVDQTLKEQVGGSAHPLTQVALT